jgi:thioesterase domain-containing protein
MMRIQRIRAGGTSYLLERLGGKLNRFLRRGDSQHAIPQADSSEQIQFQSERIGGAFLRSVATYQLRPVPVDVFVIRPRLVVAYKITQGRELSENFQLALDDNGWGPHVRSVRVFEVPGTHDSMVLEPNVRVLVASLRRAIGHALPPERANP